MGFPLGDKWMKYRSHQVESNKVNMTVLLALVRLLLNLVLLILHQITPFSPKNKQMNNKPARLFLIPAHFPAFIEFRYWSKWNEQITREIFSHFQSSRAGGKKKGGKAKRTFEEINSELRNRRDWEIPIFHRYTACAGDSSVNRFPWRGREWFYSDEPQSVG